VAGKTAGYQPNPAEIRAALQRIQASVAFRNSKQCQKFLDYVVEHSLSGSIDLLHERQIGIAVFGREPGYDTSEDPVVRVRANEVRKRLAQYYQENPSAEARFEIPPGTYRVEFRPAGVTKSDPDKAPHSRRWWVALGALLTLAGVAGILLRGRAASKSDAFWAPLLASPNAVLIACGQPVAYFLSPEVHEKYRATQTPDRLRGSYAVRLDPEAPLRGRDIIPVADQFVGIGNSHAVAMLTALLAARKRAFVIRYSNDLSFSDLRNSPAILVGAFSNFWTLEMTGDLRFTFEQEGRLRRIRDRAGNQTWQPAGLAPDGKADEDYAIVSRVFHSKSGQWVVGAAGVTQYGTRAAGEFLSEERGIGETLAKAPQGWSGRNLQVVLKTSVVRGIPSPPEVVATHFW